MQTWEWQWGDGSVSYGPTATHRYASQGTYQVRLVAHFADGRTSSSMTSVTTLSATAPKVAGIPTWLWIAGGAVFVGAVVVGAQLWKRSSASSAKTIVKQPASAANPPHAAPPPATAATAPNSGLGPEPPPVDREAADALRAAAAHVERIRVRAVARGDAEWIAWAEGTTAYLVELARELKERPTPGAIAEAQAGAADVISVEGLDEGG